MKVSLRSYVACALYTCALALSAPSAHALDVGGVLPALNVVSEGKTLDFAKLKGKVIYVDFWASWCGPCKQSFPWMNEMHAKYAARGLEIVAINVDAKAEDAQRFLAASAAKFTVALDPKGESPKLLGVKAMPTSYLIDSNGKVVLVHSGFRDSDRAPLEVAIQGALSALGK